MFTVPLIIKTYEKNNNGQIKLFHDFFKCNGIASKGKRIEGTHFRVTIPARSCLAWQADWRGRFVISVVSEVKLPALKGGGSLRR
jgi:hypothetical protein